MGSPKDPHRLRVGFVCHGWYPDPGGVETHTRDLARALIGRGLEVHALCLDYSEGREPYSVRDEEIEGVRVRRMAYRYHDHRGLADLVSNHGTTDRAESWVREHGIDLVHVHHLTGFGLGLLWRLAPLRIRSVMTLHDYWPLCPRGQMMQASGEVCARPEPEVCAACLLGTWPHLMPSRGGDPRDARGGTVATDAEAADARTRYALAALAQADLLLTPSGAARDVYVRAGLRADAVRVCENGVDVGTLATQVRRLRAERPPRDQVALGVLGSVLPSKGTLELARAFVQADAPQLTLEVHGNLPPYHGDLSYVEELQELAREEERIRLHGAYTTDELAGILADLDGVAAPSRWAEVYGLTVREASAAGLPVLVSDAGGLASVTQGGSTGRVVGEGEWVEALTQFAREPRLREAWSEAPRVLWSTSQMAEEIEALYRSLG